MFNLICLFILERPPFLLVKGMLETRPVYVSLKDHINAHFLTCFIALTIML